MSTKSTKIKWSNNLDRQSHVVDCAMAILLGAYIVTLGAFFVFGVGANVITNWTVAVILVAAAIIAFFGIAQIVFTVAPLIALRKQNR